MIGVKICGITNVSDACSAVQCGADAIGFIFYPKSLRYVRPEKVERIVKNLPSEVIRVGVFVNQEVQEVREIVEFCALDLAQLHGDESAQYCSQFPISSLIKAVSPRAEREIQDLKNYPVRAILVDASEPGGYGGTGKISNWSLAIKIKETHPLVLAGGLNTDNVRAAIDAVRPEAVDINSGAEASPGKKDPDKMRRIIGIVRETEKQEEFKTEGGLHAKIFTR
jgi:phosphoribosylanthranilate isomerase